jgi:hypothetical protein
MTSDNPHGNEIVEKGLGKREPFIKDCFRGLNCSTFADHIRYQS